MKISRTAKILSLSVAALLVVVIIVIVIRRRGRKDNNSDVSSPMSGGASIENIIASITGKKAEIIPIEKQNGYIPNYYNDFNNFYYFDKTLEYVVVPQNADSVVDEGGRVFVEIVAVGHLLPNGRLVRTVLNKKCYIAESVLVRKVV